MFAAGKTQIHEFTVQRSGGPERRAICTLLNVILPRFIRKNITTPSTGQTSQANRDKGSLVSSTRRINAPRSQACGEDATGPPVCSDSPQTFLLSGFLASFFRKASRPLMIFWNHVSCSP